MSTISSNDANVITINGKRIQAQGIARVKDGMTTEDAASKLKNAGIDEMIVSTRDASGKARRLVIYGDQLDFSFRSKERIPEVRVNGVQASLISFQHTPSSFLEATLRGAVDGVRNAFDSLESLGKNGVTGTAVAGGGALLGGTFYAVATKGISALTVQAALATLGPTIASATVAIPLSAVGLIMLAGAVKGGMAALNAQPKMEAIASVIDDTPPELPAAPAKRPSGLDAVSAPAPTRPVVAPVTRPKAPTPAASFSPDLLLMPKDAR